MRERITYRVGNENNPGNPFGRQELTIEPDGRARLDHHTRGPHFAWTGTVRSSVLDRFWAALGESDFPALPRHPMPAGSTTRSLTVGEKSSFVAYHASASLPGYAVVFSLLDTLILQLSEGTVKVVPASDETLVDHVTPAR